MDKWMGNRIIVLNRDDMISTADRNAWASYYARQGTKGCLLKWETRNGCVEVKQASKGIGRRCNHQAQSQRVTSSTSEFLIIHCSLEPAFVNCHHILRAHWSYCSSIY